VRRVLGTLSARFVLERVDGGVRVTLTPPGTRMKDQIKYAHRTLPRIVEACQRQQLAVEANLIDWTVTVR